ncbi:MAG: guanylate kinase [Bryobacterales bacterium]|nr:guanylate kinase [Bryobacterales bacterium]
MSVVLVISAPSGAGKSTLVERLVAHDDELEFAVSATSRPPRRQEVPGRAYRFVSAERFRRMVADGAFLEWAEVFGNLYGTPKDALEGASERGRDIVLDIDVQGAAQLMKKLPEAVTVFILPPSRHALEERLRNRSSEKAHEVERRLGAAAGEVRQYQAYQYVIVNDDIESSVAALRMILAAERSKRGRMAGPIQPILEEFGIDPEEPE